MAQGRRWPKAGYLPLHIWYLWKRDVLKKCLHTPTLANCIMLGLNVLHKLSNF